MGGSYKIKISTINAFVPVPANWVCIAAVADDVMMFDELPWLIGREIGLHIFAVSLLLVDKYLYIPYT